MFRPSVATVNPRVASAIDGAAPNRPAKLFGRTASPTNAKADTSVPPIRKRRMSSSILLCSQDFLLSFQSFSTIRAIRAAASRSQFDFLFLQVVQNLGRLTFRSQMHVCQDSKRCPPLLWSLDDQHVE